jgi:hypothetical protein
MSDRPTSQDVLLALLALDSYSRGANAQILDKTGQFLATTIGSANWNRDSDALPGSISFPYAYEALLLLAAKQTKIAKDISVGIEEFRSWLKPILDLLPELWMKAKETPLIFAPFSLPPATMPNSVIIHNWAFASINFALSMGELPSILTTLELAAESSILRDPIFMTRATRLAASDWKRFGTTAIQSEDRKTFYAALGQRLAQIRKIPTDPRASIMQALLDQCFRQGPHGLDLAAFLTAIEMGICNFDANSDYQNYMKRLDNDRDLRLAIAPILHDVANNSTSAPDVPL